MIRRATVQDVPELGKIINDCAEYGQMLHRSHAYLYEHLRDFHVADLDERVEGVCGLNIVWANLAEVYALAVAPAARGRGLGRELVEACIGEAQQLGVRRTFSLTYERVFFEKIGFGVVDRQQLPLKVWSECVRCMKNQSCDEIAMVLELLDVPETAAPHPAAPPRDSFVVPVTIKVGQTQPATRMTESP